MQQPLNTEGNVVELPKPSAGYLFAKRTFDVCASACAIVGLSPVLAATAFAVKATSPGPVIFKQNRYGRNKEPFVCYKFRSMKQDADAHVPTSVMQEDKAVMTPIGSFIRKWSLDELPQLVNILKGDMSVIGPRPMILEEYEQIEARDRYGANDIRPGLSGWAQVHGRDAVGIEDKARFDGWYREHMSAMLDLRTIGLSLVTVVTRNGYISDEAADRADPAAESPVDFESPQPGREPFPSAREIA